MPLEVLGKVRFGDWLLAYTAPNLPLLKALRLQGSNALRGEVLLVVKPPLAVPELAQRQESVAIPVLGRWVE